MGVRERLERVAAWFGFGVDDDEYYEEEEDRRSYAKDRYAGEASDAEPHPTVRPWALGPFLAFGTLWVTSSAAKAPPVGSTPMGPRVVRPRTSAVPYQQRYPRRE